MMSLVRCQSPRHWATVSVREGKRIYTLETNLRALEAMIMSAVRIGEDSVLIFQTPITSNRKFGNGRKMTRLFAQAETAR
jgi:ABC-type enterochelin transport system permease subunit